MLKILHSGPKRNQLKPTTALSIAYIQQVRFFASHPLTITSLALSKPHSTYVANADE